LNSIIYFYKKCISILKKYSKKYNKYINYKMKDYGEQKRKKIKKKFEVIMNTGTHGFFSDFTLRKVAKKVTSKLAEKNKHIIFQLRENRKNRKTYGPYIGRIKDGNAMVRIYKMIGGDLINCVFNSIKINNFRTNDNNSPEIKITKFCITNATIIFFNFIEYNKKKYYKYVIYREGNNVFLLELEISDDNKLEIKKIEINEIDKGDHAKQKIILEKIIGQIKEKQKKNPKFGLKIQNKIQLQLDSIKNNEERIYNTPNKFFSQPQNSIQIEFNEKLNSIIRNIKPRIPKNILLRNIKKFKKPLNTSEEIAQFYICPIENFLEVRRNSYSQIIFGFDPTLFSQKNGSFIFYYRYGYFVNTFRELLKDENGIFNDKEIDISNISLYDLLCLLEFAKINNIVEFLNLVINNLNIRKQKQLFTISLSDHKFEELQNSNYNKKRNTNIGKIKSKRILLKSKTYYFFGEYSNNKFRYACYRLEDKVFYFEINTDKKEKLLEECKDREALQELKSFIILRRNEIKDPNFGDIVYEKVSENIVKLKLQEILSKNQIFILPRSQTVIE
jgi:hypothetical protein